MSEIKNDENSSEALDQDQMNDVSRISLSPATWRKLDGPSPIQQPRLNRNDSHLRVSSKPLIEDEMPDRMATSKFDINSIVFRHYNAFFRVIELSRHHHP